MKNFYLLAALACSLGSVKGQYVENILTESWNEDEVWERATRESFSYNEDGNNLLIYFQNWNLDDLEWDHNYLYSYRYHSNGYLDSTIHQMYNFTHWSKKLKSAYSYNGSSLIDEIVEDRPVGDEWDHSIRKSITYNSSGKQTELMEDAWDTNTELWDNYQRDVRTYNTDGEVSEHIFQHWIDAGSASYWQDYMEITYAYNSNDLETESETSYMIDSVWMSAVKYTTTYSSNNKMDTRTKWEWSTYFEDWEEKFQDLYSYNTDGTIHQIHKNKMNEDTDQYEDFQKMTYTYHLDIGLDENSELNFTIYPNPTSEKLVVDLKEDGMAKISFGTLDGKVLLEVESNEVNRTLDIARFPAGIYSLTVNQNGTSLSTKVIKR